MSVTLLIPVRPLLRIKLQGFCWTLKAKPKAGMDRKSAFLFLILFISIVRGGGHNGMPPLPPGIEIVNPKDLGFSEEEIDKILGKVNLMGGGPNGNGGRTQILTVGIDANKKVNMESIAPLRSHNLSPVDKAVRDMVSKQFGNKATPPSANRLRHSRPPPSPPPQSFRPKSEESLSDINAQLQRQIMKTLELHEEQLTRLNQKEKQNQSRKEQFRAQPSEVVTVNKGGRRKQRPQLELFVTPPPQSMEQAKVPPPAPKLPPPTPSAPRVSTSSYPKVSSTFTSQVPSTSYPRVTSTYNPRPSSTSYSGVSSTSSERPSSTSNPRGSSTFKNEALPTSTSPVSSTSNAPVTSRSYPHVPVSKSPKPFPEEIKVRIEPQEIPEPFPETITISTPQPPSGEVTQLDPSQQQQILGDVQQQGPILFGTEGEGTQNVTPPTELQVIQPQENPQQIHLVQPPIYIQQQPGQQVTVQGQVPPQQQIIYQHPPQFALAPPPQPQITLTQTQGIPPAPAQQLVVYPPQQPQNPPVQPPLVYQPQPQPQYPQRYLQPHQVQYVQIPNQAPNPEYTPAYQPQHQFQPAYAQGQPKPELQYVQIQNQAPIPQYAPLYQREQQQAQSGHIQGQPQPEVYIQIQNEAPNPKFSPVQQREQPSFQRQSLPVQHSQIQQAQQQYFQEPPSQAQVVYHQQPEQPPQHQVIHHEPPQTQIYVQPSSPPEPTPTYTSRETYSLSPQTIVYPGGLNQGKVRGHSTSKNNVQSLGFGSVEVIHKGHTFEPPMPPVEDYDNYMKYKDWFGKFHSGELRNQIHSKPEHLGYKEEPRPMIYSKKPPYFFESEYYKGQRQREHSRAHSYLPKSSTVEYDFYKGEDKIRFPESESSTPSFFKSFGSGSNEIEYSTTPRSFNGPYKPTFPSQPQPPGGMIRLSSPENAMPKWNGNKSQSPIPSASFRNLLDQMRAETRPAPVSHLPKGGTHYNKNTDPLFALLKKS